MRLQSAQHCTALHNAVFLIYGQVDFSKATESISEHIWLLSKWSINKASVGPAYLEYWLHWCTVVLHIVLMHCSLHWCIIHYTGVLLTVFLYWTLQCTGRDSYTAYHHCPKKNALSCSPYCSASQLLAYLIPGAPSETKNPECLIRSTIHLPVFLNYGQVDFSKASESISEHIQLLGCAILPLLSS